MVHKEIHHTDFAFQKYCEEKFGINRGIYNTIDAWFFNRGYKNIVIRRNMILNFLSYTSGKLQSKKSTTIKFGPGGLKQQLYEFYDKLNMSS